MDEESRLRISAESRVTELEKQNQERDNKFKQESELRQKAEDKVVTLENDVKEVKKGNIHIRLIISAIFRSILSILLLIGIEVVICIIARKYGEGANLFIKLTNAWPWLCVGFAIVAILYPFIMGRKIMQLLKWWKGDSNNKEFNQ